MSTCNKDAAMECFIKSYRVFQSGDVEKTIRLLTKCKNMYPTLNPQNFGSSCNFFSEYESLDLLIENVPSLYEQHFANNGHSSSNNSNGDSNDHGDENGDRIRRRRRRSNEQNSLKEGVDYSKEDAEEVKRVLSCQNDYYKVLGIERNADNVAIKKGYRKMAVKLHPDKNKAPHATEAFKIVSAAYICLSDSEKRKLYDQYGTEDVQKINEQRNPFAYMRQGRASRSPFLFRTNMGSRHFDFDEEELFFELFAQMFERRPMSRMYTQRGRQAHRQFTQQERQHYQTSNGRINMGACFQLLIFIFIILFFNMSFFSLNRGSSISKDRAAYYDPKLGNVDAPFSFTNVLNYKVRLTVTTDNEHKITYFVPQQLYNQMRYNIRLVKPLEEQVISSYKVYLEDRCKEEENKKKEQLLEAKKSGDALYRENLLQKIYETPLLSCERLTKVYG